MKRAAVLLGLAVITPSVAGAQVPVFQPAPSVAPSKATSGAAPSTPALPGAPPEQKAPPGDEYYVEPAPTGPPASGAAGPTPPPPFEPPLPEGPEGPYFEPPPPPPTIHLAPRNSLWLGARLGWFFPFGNVFAQAQPVTTGAGSAYVLQGVPWRDYASSGPTFELDAGARVSRAYTVFALWERAQLGAGRNSTGRDGPQDHAESDFWAVGLRASTNPDTLGFLTEVAVGYRRARTLFKNDVEYQFTDAPFEARLGLGAELRLNRLTSLSSLLAIGVGGFGSIERVSQNGTASSLTRSIDEADGHVWLTLTIGAHFDLIRSAK
jgi:hypothetical protein